MQWRNIMKQPIGYLVLVLCMGMSTAYATLGENKNPGHEKAVRKKDAQRLYAEAMELLAIGRQKDAEKLVADACITHPSSQRLLFLRGVMERSRFHRKAAFQTFSEVYALDVDTVLGRVVKVSISLDFDFGIDAGLESMRSLIAEHPEEILFRWLFAIQCRTHGRCTEEAAEQYETILRKWNPAPVMVNHTYANILTESLGQPKKALEFRQQALSQAQQGYTYQGYGNTLRKLGRYEEACAAFEKAVEIKPDSQAYRRQWGDCMAEIGKEYETGNNVERNFVLALEWYRKGLEKGSENALADIGRLYAKGGYGIDRDLVKAEAWVQKLIASTGELDEGRADSYQVGNLKLRKCAVRDGFGVCIDFRKTLALNETTAMQGDLDAKEFVAWLYSVCDDLMFVNGEKAVRLASELCLVDERNPIWKNTLAAAYARLGDLTRAVAEQEEAIALLPKNRREGSEGKAYMERLELYKGNRTFSAYCGLVGSDDATPRLLIRRQEPSGGMRNEPVPATPSREHLFPKPENQNPKP